MGPAPIASPHGGRSKTTASRFINTEEQTGSEDWTNDNRDNLPTPSPSVHLPDRRPGVHADAIVDSYQPTGLTIPPQCIAVDNHPSTPTPVTTPACIAAVTAITASRPPRLSGKKTLRKKRKDTRWNIGKT